MKPSRTLPLLVTLLAAAVALSWAGPAPQGDVLVVGHHLDPTTLDPFGTTTAAFQSVFAQIVEQLVVFDAERAAIRPWLATSWRWLDPTTLEVQLRRGVSFSNGEPFDAAAARYSLELLFRAAPYSAWTQDLVRSVETAGSHTVRIRLVRPSAFLLPLLARGSFVVPPRHHQEVGPARFAQQPVGTGPFVLSEWAKGARIVLDRNPRYWGGPHPLRQVVFRVIPDDAARVVALQTGEIHVALNAPITHFNRLKIDRNLRVIAAPGLRKFTSFFNTRLDTPLRDRRVRVAMNLAVDLQSIVRRVYGGQAQALPGHWILPQEFGHDPSLKPFAFDPARARQLLAEAGFPNGFETQLTYTVGRYPLDKELGEIVAGSLEAIGVRVRQRPVEYGEFLRLRSAGQLGPIHQWGLLVPPDAHFSYSLFTKGSIYRFHDYPEEWDRLIDQAASELDPRRREAIYRRLAVISHEDPFGIYLLAPGNLYAMRANVRGLVPRFDEVLWLYGVSVDK